jgi:hypothetical protein
LHDGAHKHRAVAHYSGGRRKWKEEIRTALFARRCFPGAGQTTPGCSLDTGKDKRYLLIKIVSAASYAGMRTDWKGGRDMDTKVGVKSILFFSAACIALASTAFAAPAIPVNVMNSPNVNVVNTPTVNIAPGASVGIDGIPTVTIGNTAATAVPVRDADHRGRRPWQMSGQVLFDFPDNAHVTTFNPPIPTGKIFVIDFMTAHASLPSGQKTRLILFTDTGFTITQHYFAPLYSGTDFTVDNSHLSQMVSLYAITAPMVNVTRYPDNAGSGFVNLSLSGYLIDQ